jgi:threonine dehydrogenase-like Zn-dependent dehydrogenase
MQALVARPGEASSLVVEEVAVPRPAPGEALVRTLELGVCGTDRSIGAGHFGRAPDDSDRLVIGHEVLGEVIDHAPGLPAGTLVAATVRRSCGHCDNCAEGEMDACTTGDFLERGIVGLDGFASEVFAEQPENLIPIPRSLGRLGVLAEPASIAERGLRHATAVGQRQGWAPRRAIVLGVGALGVLSVLALRLRGIETWALSRGPQTSPKAEIVEMAGAQYASTQDLSLTELAAEIGGPDLILEAAGNPELMVEAIAALGINGVLCLRGIDTENRELRVPANLFSEEIVLYNKAIIGSTNASHRDWIQAVDDLQAIHERWPEVLGAVIGDTAAPEDFRRALDTTSVKAAVRFA